MNEKHKPAALVLGGTVPHAEMIRQLKERGYYTILIDYLDDSPAKKEADLHIQESTMDQEKVYEAAREWNASLVISGCVDQANISACYAMEKLGLPVPYSYKLAVDITNKGVMKRVMTQNHIPTSKYLYFEENDQISDNDLQYPVMIKPADSYSSNGVKKAYSREEAERYLKDALAISRNKRAVMEEFVEGREISAYSFVTNKKAKLLMTAERISTLDGDDKVLKCFATIAPSGISREIEEKVEQIGTQIAEAFGLDNTPLFYQLIVSGDKVNVLEFAPRVGGGVSFRTLKENTGFDIISATIDSWEGKQVDLSSYRRPSRLLVINIVYGKDGVFDHLENVEKVLEEGLAIAFYQARVKGSRVDNTRANSSRIGTFIVNAKDREDLLDKVHRVYETVKVVDIHGNNMIRKDMNLEGKAW